MTLPRAVSSSRNEVCTVDAVYAGWPSAISAAKVARQVSKEAKA